MKAIFFRNVRGDGGVHLGLEADEELLFDESIPGATEPDAALDWYLDIQFEGDGLPHDAEALRRWILAQAPAINAALDALAKRLEVGADVGPYPFVEGIVGLPDEIRGVVKGSALRGIRATDVAQRLSQAHERWEADLVRMTRARELAPVSE